ncbi:MAG TPA: M12 family metallo-peptidase [Thermoanaerobaculia bacterium]|nr:M12 family metallo-peptidase [Thermoanaerobaculia bacterium]
MRPAQMLSLLLPLALALPAAVAAGPSPAGSRDDLWQPLAAPRARSESRHRLDRAGLDALLSRAPREGKAAAAGAPPVITLPLPGGTYARFAVVESPIMEPALAARYPQIRTYALAGVDRAALRGRLDASPRGVHAIVLGAGGTVLVDPVAGGDGATYRSAFDRAEPVVCGVEEAVAGSGAGLTNLALAAVSNPNGDTLRTYRIAIATTAEYYQARGGNDLDVLASIITVLNRVDMVYRAELAITFVLVADTEDLFFTDPDTDGYTNGDECTMRGENVTVTDGILDDGDYDVGHVFGMGSGGCAGGSLVCQSGAKANGASNLNTNAAPGQEGFSGYRLVVHELGHQFGASHTWSGSGGNCTAGQFAAGSAYEPGGGTTQMAYSGTCGASNNIQTTTNDTYFHTHSFDQITAYVAGGGACSSNAATGNSAPEVDAGADYTIPRDTPFVLTGSADDPDGDALAFTWEQYDLAPGQFVPNADPGSGPLFRSFPPAPSPVRVFPRLSDVVNNTTTLGEMLPQLDRVDAPLTFRLTARDQRQDGGGVDYDTVEISVLGEPFRVTNPNALALFGAGCTEEVTWEVGGGAIAGFVDVAISSDGGFTYAPPLAAGVPNDGAEEVVLPCAANNAARIRVAAADNIFFDISNANFTVAAEEPEVAASAVGGEVDAACQLEVTFTATVEDDCAVAAGNVEVEAAIVAGSADLSNLTFATQQVDGRTVTVTGSALVANLMGGPATVRFDVDAADACGFTGGASAEAVVADTTPPTIAVTLDPALLWPPNHKLVPVGATVVAADNCPGVAFALTALTSDEPDDAQGGGDGHTTGDIRGTLLGTADTAFFLRAERQGAGNGRVYTVVYTATDGSGNEAEASDEVIVPKSAAQIP